MHDITESDRLEDYYKILQRQKTKETHCKQQLLFTFSNMQKNMSKLCLIHVDVYSSQNQLRQRGIDLLHDHCVTPTKITQTKSLNFVPVF